jgi:glycosyltransferase involved in cell wall biosynthesis
VKIGFYGGVANNMYVFAKAFHAAGVDVCFIRDRSDKYPFSQPVWEDNSFTMHFEEVPRASRWDWEQWSRLERETGWAPPAWMVDPLQPSPHREVAVDLGGLAILDRIGTSRYLREPHRRHALAAMRACDALMVCGIEGSILARFSGKPYIIWPHGGDLMIAAGMLQPPLRQVRQWVVHGILARHLRAAFDGAICVGNHEPSGISNAFWGAEHYIQNLPVVFMPIPIPVRPRASADVRRERLAEVLREMGMDTEVNGLTGFVPSRIDYKWKGQDRLLSAIQMRNAVLRKARAKIIFAGWGGDLLHARQFAAENDIADITVFLDVAISKPLLFRFYDNVDFAVDQFTLGMYGTAALEAMAGGCPLMIWLNNAYERSWGAPPVMNVMTAEQIAQGLESLVTGQYDLQSASGALQSWMEKTHGALRVIPEVLAAFENPESVSRGW